MPKTVRMISTSPVCAHYGRRIPPGEAFDCDEDIVDWMVRNGRAKRAQTYQTRVMTAEEQGSGEAPKRKVLHARSRAQ